MRMVVMDRQRRGAGEPENLPALDLDARHERHEHRLVVVRMMDDLHVQTPRGLGAGGGGVVGGVWAPAGASVNSASGGRARPMRPAFVSYGRRTAVRSSGRRYFSLVICSSSSSCNGTRRGGAPGVVRSFSIAGRRGGPRGVITALQARETGGLIDLPRPPQFRPGDRLQVTHGPFAGHVGLYRA